MCIVAEIWQQNGLKQDGTTVIQLIFKFISQTLETLSLTNGCVRTQSRNQTSHFLYKILTTCLTVLIFGSGKYHH